LTVKRAVAVARREGEKIRSVRIVIVSEKMTKRESGVHFKTWRRI
jgi:hypothetical protein